MPTVQLNGTPLYYNEDGDRRRPTIVLVHSVLFGGEILDDLAADLRRDFHLVRVDVHGHGQSGFHAPLTIDGMTADLT
jgi:3-oxoadipate enol-lactonase